jgi:hypothetical protein
LDQLQGIDIHSSNSNKSGTELSGLFAHDSNDVSLWNTITPQKSWEWNLDISGDEDYIYLLETNGGDTSFFYFSTTTGANSGHYNFLGAPFNQYSRSRLTSQAPYTMYFTTKSGGHGMIWKFRIGESVLLCITYSGYNIPWDIIPVDSSVAIFPIMKSDDSAAIFTKVDFSLASPTLWSTQIITLGGTNNQFGAALLSSDGSTVYNVLAFDNTILFILINESDGSSVSSNKFPYFKYKLSATGTPDIARTIFEANNNLYCLFYLNSNKILVFSLVSYESKIYETTTSNLHLRGLINNGNKMLIYGYHNTGSRYDAFYLTSPINVLGASPSIQNYEVLSLDPITTSTDYDVSPISLGAISVASHTLQINTHIFPIIDPGTSTGTPTPTTNAFYVDDVKWNDLYPNTNYSKTEYLTCGKSVDNVASSLSPLGIFPIPQWISFFPSTFLFTFTTPSQPQPSQHKFRVKSTVGSENFYRNFFLSVLEWKVENWKLWMPSSVSQWQQWEDGYEVQTDGKWQQNMDETLRNVQRMGFGIFGLAMIAIIIGSIVSMSSPQMAFSLINTLQLAILLPLIGTYLPNQVILFIKGFDFVLLSPSIFGFKDILHQNQWENELSKTQTNEYLFDIGIETTSTAINLFGIFSILLVTTILHIIIAFAYLIFKLCKLKNLFVKFIKLVLKIMTIGVYLRLALEGYLFLFLSATSELKLFKYDHLYFSISLGITIALLFIYAVIWVVWVILLLKAKKKKVDVNTSIFKELLNGLKSNYVSRSFILFFLTKRTLMIVLLIIFNGMKVFYKKWIFSSIQIISWMLIAFTKPFSDAKNNLVEILNEVIFSICCLVLFIFYTKSMWNSTIEWAFIGLLLSTSVITAVVSIVTLAGKIVKSIKNYRNKKIVLPKRMATAPTKISKVNASSIQFMNEESKYQNEPEFQNNRPKYTVRRDRREGVLSKKVGNFYRRERNKPERFNFMNVN